MNRSRESAGGQLGGLPPELWAVIALLCIAGLFTGVPVVRAFPDALELATDAGLWSSFGLLVIVLLVELGLFAVACFVLAAQLRRGDPVARIMTVVVAGSLGFGLLVGDGLGATEGKVTLVCCLAAVACLTAPARAREFFAGRRRQGTAPAPVVAAEAAVVLVATILLGVGIAFLPLSSEKVKYVICGLGLVGISVACFRTRRRLQTADPGARALQSGLMAGYVVAILLGSEGSLTGPLFIPLGVAVAVVALLWLPHESQAFFGGEPTMAGLAAAGPDEFEPEPIRTYRTTPRGVPPPPEAHGPPSAFERPSPPDAPPPPVTRPPASRSRQPAPSAPAPPAPAPISTGTPAAVDPTAPPPWLLKPPPAGFWPVERRRGEPRRHEVVDLASSPPGDEAVALTLGIRFDTTSWFPVLDAREQVRGRYLVSMVMFDESPSVTAFRGISTLLVTSTRLLGVCPRGESEAGPIDAADGRVAVWRILLDQVDWVRAEGSAEGGHLIVEGWDSVHPWALLAKARAAGEGGVRPASLDELADLINRAKHSTA